MEKGKNSIWADCHIQVPDKHSNDPDLVVCQWKLNLRQLVRRDESQWNTWVAEKK